MVGSSILPVALYKNQLYFLFGKENPLEDSSKGWSDFGGGVEKNHSVYDTATREGAEELTGFLGDKNQVHNMLKKSGKKYKLVHMTNGGENAYHVHMFLTEYDENLPKYYNNNHSFLWENMDKNVLNKTKFFEKIEIKWFSVDEMRKRRNEFRGFYREIVDKMLAQLPHIRSHMRTQQSKKNKKTKKTQIRKQNKQIRTRRANN